MQDAGNKFHHTHIIIHRQLIARTGSGSVSDYLTHQELAHVGGRTEEGCQFGGMSVGTKHAQKSRNNHTLELMFCFEYASRLPSGDGIAQPS